MPLGACSKKRALSLLVAPRQQSSKRREKERENFKDPAGHDSPKIVTDGLIIVLFRLQMAARDVRVHTASREILIHRLFFFSSWFSRELPLWMRGDISFTADTGVGDSNKPKGGRKKVNASKTILEGDQNTSQ